MPASNPESAPICPEKLLQNCRTPERSPGLGAWRSALERPRTIRGLTPYEALHGGLPEALLTKDGSSPSIEPMPLTIPSTALRQISGAELTRLVEAAFMSASLAEYIAILDARLRVFEQRYELRTSELPKAIEDGVLRDTADVSDWLF